MKKIVFSLLVVFALVLGACAPAATPAPTEEPMAEPTPEPTEVMLKDIVDTAVADGRFTTLVSAVTAAGLVDTLKAKVPSPSSPPLMTPLPLCPKAPSKVCWPTSPP